MGVGWMGSAVLGDGAFPFWVRDSLGEEPRWVRTGWAARVLDFRFDPDMSLEGRVGVLWGASFGEVLVQGVRGCSDGVGEVGDWLGLLFTVGGVSSGVVVSERGGEGEGGQGGALGRLVCGLCGALPLAFQDLGVHPPDDYPVEDQEVWEVRMVGAAHAAAPSVHAALLAGPSWWEGAMDGWGAVRGAVALTQWSSLGVRSGREALGWVHGGVEPLDLWRWRAAGWDDAGVPGWHAVFREADEAAAWRDAGFSADGAAGWVQRAQWVHPVTAAVLAATGRWDPQQVTLMRRALLKGWPELRFAGPALAGAPTALSGDAVLGQWAALVWASSRRARLCALAGLSPSEADALFRAGDLDVKTLKVMMALRR